MNYYNTFLRDDLLSLRNNINIILVLYESQAHHELIPTALEDFIEKVQELTDYVEDLPVDTQTNTFSCNSQTGVKSGRPSRLNNY